MALAAGASLAACASTGFESTSSGPAYADFLVGRLANLTDDYAAASERYTAALARAPDDQNLVDGAVIAALASGNIERAREAARHAHGEDASAYARLVRAADAIVTQHWAQADAELLAANGGAAPALTARVLRVWVQAGQNRLGADLDGDLRPLLAIRPFGGLLQYQQAMALDYAGRNGDALRAYSNAAGLGLWLPAAIERNADLLARRGARDEAIALLDSPANQTDPSLVAAAQRLRAGQGVSVAPLTPARGAAAVLYGLAAIYLQESDTTNGLATLTLALALDASADQARLAFAQAQSDLHHGDLARAMLRAVAPPSPYAGSARAMEAWTLLAEHRDDEAVALARTAAATGDMRAKRTLADIYRASHHDAEAEAIYSELLTATADDWRLWFARGAARIRLNRVAEGEADLQHALQLSPEQPDVLNYLGYTWIDRGERLTEAAAMIQRAMALRPESAAIIDSLAWAYYRMGDYPHALEQSEHAVEIEAGDPMLNDHLGDIYWRLGRRIEARYQWQRALTLEPDDAAAIQSKLDHGLPPETPARAARR
jgi:Tfp pilus assembly protein PilF